MKKIVFLFLLVILNFEVMPCSKDKACSLPPEASFVYSLGVLDLKEVTFDGSASRDTNGGSNTLDYSWSIGGVSQTLSGEIVTYRFQSYGRYKVTLTVVNSGGLSHTISSFIDVFPAYIEWEVEKVSVSEASSQITIKYELSKPAPADVDVELSFSGTARSEDIILDINHILIAQGTEAGELTLLVNDDSIPESDETFEITLNTLNTDLVIPGEKKKITITILDNDSNQRNCNGEHYVNDDGSIGGVVSPESVILRGSYIGANAYICGTSFIDGARIEDNAYVLNSQILGSVSLKDNAVVVNSNLEALPGLAGGVSGNGRVYNATVKGTYIRDEAEVNGSDKEFTIIEKGSLNDETVIQGAASLYWCDIYGSSKVLGEEAQGPTLQRSYSGFNDIVWNLCILENTTVESVDGLIPTIEGATLGNVHVKGNVDISWTYMIGETNIEVVNIDVFPDFPEVDASDSRSKIKFSLIMGDRNLFGDVNLTYVAVEGGTAITGEFTPVRINPGEPSEKVIINRGVVLKSSGLEFDISNIDFTRVGPTAIIEGSSIVSSSNYYSCDGEDYVGNILEGTIYTNSEIIGCNVHVTSGAILSNSTVIDTNKTINSDITNQYCTSGGCTYFPKGNK